MNYMKNKFRYLGAKVGKKNKINRIRFKNYYINKLLLFSYRI